MKITILWEDQRGTATKGFGPHELLISCIEDDCGLGRTEIARQISSEPKKGNGSVLRDIRQNITRMANAGPVFAVLDRDKAHETWSSPAPNCISGTISKLKETAGGDYETVLLINNIESLLNAVLYALNRPVLEAKPRPNDRDSILQQAAYAEPAIRRTIRTTCPSFDRLVRRVIAQLPAVKP